ncbi:MAG TPA: serine/threonine-protein kinase [Urbifossiella sp.]|nr:serine/threonine-protein kinase [Urbifossiella sp.]
MNTIADTGPTDPRDGGLPGTRVVEAIAPPRVPPDNPAAGMQIGEFLLLEEVGRGAFGRVFLAEQEALNRRVALKVSKLRAKTAEEGKSLGGLEHESIVKVYSTFTDEHTGWQCLCLQYVPGADLRAVIDRLYANGTPAVGRDILAALDAVGRRDAPFDAAALRDRDALAADDFPQAVCRLGGRLAEALAFAHARGVLHCDIKPANILLSPYARPMLVDFNVAFDRTRRGDSGALGGTRFYMAPEHELALKDRTPAVVDARCDIYSLGVVLHELATGKKPIPVDLNGEEPPDPLDAVPRELAAVIRRCLQPDAAKRYQSADELVRSLSGAWQLLAARRALPRPERLGRWSIAHPIAALALASMAPHLAASAVNITFNAVQIQLNEHQKQAFAAMVLAYNAAVYPLALAIAVILFRRVALPLPLLPRLGGTAIDELRRRVRQLGWWVVAIGAIGWFPGGLLFPLVVDASAGPFENPGATYGQFLISFTLSGLIGVVFSYLGVQYVVFRSLLPRMGNPDAYTASAMRAEVRPLIAPFGPLVLLASAIPLTGAVLLIAFTEGTMTLGFRLLMAGLIGLGAGGVALAERTVSRIHRLAAVWNATDECGHF